MAEMGAEKATTMNTTPTTPTAPRFKVWGFPCSETVVLELFLSPLTSTLSSCIHVWVKEMLIRP